MRVADYIMQRLAQAGVRHVYLVTGRGALYLSDALARHDGLVPVSLHHEQSAAFAAVASAQQGDPLGACLVSTGCASTNAITGVLSAWQDGLPCIFISGQNTLRETSRHTGIPLRTYGQQEADIVALVQPITKYARMISTAEEIVEAMETALSLAISGRKGPVWIDVPLNLQSAQIDPQSICAPAVAAPPLPLASEAEVVAVAQALREARRPALLIGHGVRSAGAEAELRRFMARWQVPLTYAASAPDTFGSAEPLSIGSVGAMGCSRAGNFTVQNADLLLVLGSRLNSLTTGSEFGQFARHARVIAVDIDPVEYRKEMVRVDQLVLSDLHHFLRHLNQLDPAPARAGWIDKCQHWKARFAAIEPQFQCSEQVDLYALAHSLSEALPDRARVVTDSGLVEVILPTHLRFREGMRCVHPASQGAMGYALPAAIGACCASGQPTVVVVGDGSIMMNLQELETIRHRKLPIKILVVNNNVYAIIRRRQRDLFRTRVVGVDPASGVSCPDFARVADCFGLEYHRIERPATLDAQLRQVLERPCAVLCEVMGRPDQGYIELGQARSVSERRFVRRPLEDQAPFLAREDFLAEMLVEPIAQ